MHLVRSGLARFGQFNKHTLLNRAIVPQLWSRVRNTPSVGQPLGHFGIWKTDMFYLIIKESKTYHWLASLGFEIFCCCHCTSDTLKRVSQVANWPMPSVTRRCSSNGRNWYIGIPFSCGEMGLLGNWRISFGTLTQLRFCSWSVPDWLRSQSVVCCCQRDIYFSGSNYFVECFSQK